MVRKAVRSIYQILATLVLAFCFLFGWFIAFELFVLEYNLFQVPHNDTRDLIIAAILGLIVYWIWLMIGFVREIPYDFKDIWQPRG